MLFEPFGPPCFGEIIELAVFEGLVFAELFELAMLELLLLPFRLLLNWNEPRTLVWVGLAIVFPLLFKVDERDLLLPEPTKCA